jgi:hypothetical protein
VIFLFFFWQLFGKKTRSFVTEISFFKIIFLKWRKLATKKNQKKKLLAQSSREDSIADLRKAKKNPSKCISSIASTEQSQDTMLCVPGPPLI